MNRRGFLKKASIPLAASVIVSRNLPKSPEELPGATEGATAKQDAPSFKVVLLDGERTISEPFDCRFRIEGSHATSLDIVYLRCNVKGESEATHIGLGEFRVPIDHGPYSFQGAGFEQITFFPGDINFSFASEPDEAA